MTAHISGKSDLPIFTDHEGGSIQWLLDGFSHLPPAKAYGIIYDADPKLAIKLAHHFGKVMAKELAAFGIIPLVPVLDLDQGNIAISHKNRAFHYDPHVSIKLLEAFIDGMDTYKIPATGKHFPDLSQDIGDPHFTTLTDRRELKDIQGLKIYEKLAHRLKAIMPAHVLYPKVDPKNIVALSKTWLDKLRSMKFTGVIVSDCLSMKGSGSENILDKAKMFLSYIDVIIICHLPPKAYLELFTALFHTHKPNAITQERISNWVSSTAPARQEIYPQIPPVSRTPGLD